MRKIVFVIFILFCSCGCTRNVFEFSILSYNLYNLFDDKVDGGEYAQYNPSNPQVWNSDLYHRRMKLFSNIILDAYRGGPDILAFQEVENEKVVKDLINYYLRGYGYNYLIFLKTDNANIGNAVVSKFPIKQAFAYKADIEEYAGLRDLLAVDIMLPVKFRLYVNHWKSRLGGDDVTFPARSAQSRLLAQAVGDYLTENKYCVVVGDFNEPVYLEREGRQVLTENYRAFSYVGEFFHSLEKLSEASLSIEETNYEGHLHITAERFAKGVSEKGGEVEDKEVEVAGQTVLFFDKEQGYTYNYQNEWLAFDAVLVSPGFADCHAWELESARVLNNEPLLNSRDEPFRWSSNYANGYSDHLPVLGIFTFMKN